MKQIILAGVILLQINSINAATLFSRSNASAMSQKSLIAKGIPVDRSFYSTQEPTITYGAIELQNLDSTIHQFTVLKINCQAGDETIPIKNFFIYRLPNYEEVEPVNIDQQPLTTTQYEISFAAIPATPYWNRDIVVEMELDIDGETLLVQSPYLISIRTKRR